LGSHLDGRSPEGRCHRSHESDFVARGFGQRWHHGGVYTTTFEKVSAVESFVWRMQSGTAQLMAYRIESPDLVGD
jgi:hypothetical protein